MLTPRFRALLQLLVVLLLMFVTSCMAQDTEHKVRIANLVIYSDQLNEYTAALKEEIKASIDLERGVLTLYAVYDKDTPNHITILEIYEDEAAYKAHIETPHFKKYKTTTQNMIESLELIETVPLIPEMKIK